MTFGRIANTKSNGGRRVYVIFDNDPYTGNDAYFIRELPPAFKNRDNWVFSPALLKKLIGSENPEHRARAEGFEALREAKRFARDMYKQYITGPNGTESNRDFSDHPRYMHDDNGNPHWHVDWNPSPEHKAALRGTPEQRARWAAEDELIAAEAAQIERSGKLGRPGVQIVNSFLNRQAYKNGGSMRLE